MNYSDELTKAMTWLGEQPNTIFMGQAVAFPGTSQTATLVGVPRDKLLELPVAENMQAGMATGMALAGFVPISIYPRYPFMLEAAGQIINHLDKLPLYSDYRPKVIIRVGIPTDKPMDPQAQHLGNYSDPFRQMLKSVEVIELTRPSQILGAYMHAYLRPDGRSTILAEYTGKFA